MNKKRKNKISFLELYQSIRKTSSLQRAKVIESKKRYNRKDKSWKKDLVY